MTTTARTLHLNRCSLEIFRQSGTTLLEDSVVLVETDQRKLRRVPSKSLPQQNSSTRQRYSVIKWSHAYRLPKTDSTGHNVMKHKEKHP